MNNILSYKPMIEEHINKLLNIDFAEFDGHIKAMNYSVSIGGKRIRPCLLMEFANICGGDKDYALDLAAAIEFIHTYSLIHDDLPSMDNDDFRRGKPSCHIKFGESTALLAGDGLLTYAFFAASRRYHPKTAECVEILSQYAGMTGMIGGQMIDLITEGKPGNKDTILKMYELKTSRLLQAACVLGCTMANAEKKKIDAAYNYAKNLGIAFQIVDDILDVIGNEEILGKPIGSDKDNEKNNMVSLLGLDNAKTAASKYTDMALDSLSVFGNKADALSKFTKELLLRNA